MGENKQQKQSVADKAIPAMDIYIQRGIRWLVKKIAGSPTVSQAVASMDDGIAQILYQIIPAVASGGIGMIHDSWFKTPERADLFRNSLNEFVKYALDEMKQLNDPNHVPTDPEEAAAKAHAKAEDEKLLMDKGGFVHLPDCTDLKLKFKKEDLHEITWKQAIEQDRQGAACCVRRLDQLKVEKSAPSRSRSNKAKLSPADVIGGAPHDIQREIGQWLLSMDDAMRQEALTMLMDLDDEMELQFIVAMPREIRLACLPALREKAIAQKKAGQDAYESLKRGAAKAVAIVRSGARKVTQPIKEFDASLADEAARLKVESDKPMSQGKWYEWLLPF